MSAEKKRFLALVQVIAVINGDVVSIALSARNCLFVAMTEFSKILYLMREKSPTIRIKWSLIKILTISVKTAFFNGKKNLFLKIIEINPKLINIFQLNFQGFIRVTRGTFSYKIWNYF